MPGQEEMEEAANAIREVLDLVSSGTWPAPSGKEIALIRRLEGAAAALEAAAGES
jgi:hypothetical protein